MEKFKRPGILHSFCYLLISYLFATCQAKQYNFFQRADAAHDPAEQRLRMDNQTAEAIPNQESTGSANASALSEGRLSEPYVPFVHPKSVDYPATATHLTQTEKEAHRKRVQAKALHPVRRDSIKTVQPPTNGLAITSFTAGLATLTSLFIPSIVAITVVLGPLALILGLISYRQIKRRGQRGKGLSLTGIAIGACYLLGIVLIVVAVRAAALSFGGFLF